MKHHKLAELVNDLTATAVKHKDCQSMREALKATLGKHIDMSDNDNKTIKSIQELENGNGYKVNNTTELFNKLKNK